MAGTPVYMAPEVLRGEPSTVWSDLYALGAVLYELCATVAPRDTLPSDADEDTWVAGIPDPIEQRAPDIDARLASAITRCIAPLPEHRFPSADALADALAVLIVGPAQPLIAGNPYRGLASFEAEHRALFFGRAAESRAVLDRLRETAFAVVTGDSGTGKSSLCRAGVVPLVIDGALADGRRYRTVTVLPGRHPYASLMAAVAATFFIDQAAVTEEERHDPAAFARALRRALGKQDGALLLIDQAEELVTFADPEEARAFGEVVARLPAATAGVRVLLSVRGDFFTRLAVLPGLGDVLDQSLFVLRPLSPEGVRAAITGPAAQHGVAFEPPDLVDGLASAAIDTAGGLPLLQFALAELWEARRGEGSITPALLQAIGGVEGALAGHAESVIGGMSPGARLAARRLLVSLVTPDATGRRRTAGELRAESSTDRTALDALVKGRLLVAREVEGDTAYELAHEALIQGWSTLRDWLTEGRESRARIERLENAATEWERLERSPELFLSGKRLAAAEGLSAEELSPRAQALLRASRAHARRRRVQRWALLAAGPLVAVVALGALRWKQERDLERLIAAHTASSDAARAEGKSRKQEALAKRSRAYALFDAAVGGSLEEVTRKKEEAEAVWSDALVAAGEAEATLVRAGPSQEAALAHDPTRVEIHGAIADVTLDRLALAEAFHAEERRNDLLFRLAAYDTDGSRQRARAAAPHLTVTTTPPGAIATLERYKDQGGRMIAETVDELGTTPLVDAEIANGPGSYRLIFRLPGRVEVRYPVLLEPAERLSLDIPLPSEMGAPRDHVFVPEGRFLLGSAELESLRKGFHVCPPLHEARTRAYWIARTEVTFGDWLAFLNALPAAEQKRRAPNTQSGMWGVRLDRVKDGWQIAFTLNGAEHIAGEDAPIRLPARSRRTELSWKSLPVTGVSMEDAEAYFRWLDATGEVPGARPCHEHEWERAARGADGRVFPHGNTLYAEDADFDLTYGRKPLAFGPDEVASHPATESPFGLFDMTGNAYELTVSAGADHETVMRGGTWYFDIASAMIPNRTMGERQTRDHLTGVRGCASVR